MSATVESVNTANAAPASWASAGRTAIDKRPVHGPVPVARLGLDGDEQADRRHHGGPDQAVYAFAREDLDAWAADLGRALPGGAFGENLTTAGIEVTDALIGERWQVGTVTLQVSAPRTPCRTFAGHLAEPGWVRRFTERARPGAYLRVITPGVLTAGDAVTVSERPAHAVSVGFAFRALHTDPALLPALAEVSALPRAEREIVRRRLAGQG